MTLMNKNYTVNEMADLLVELGKRKYKNDRNGLGYCFAYGTMTALFQQALYGFDTTQTIVNNKCLELQKELAAA
jgi:hypothetical protein